MFRHFKCELVLLFIFGINANNNRTSLSFRQYLCKKEPCGANANCIFSDDGGFCQCKCGFKGNPYESCVYINPDSATRVLMGLELPFKYNFHISKEELYLELVKEGNLIFRRLLLEDAMISWGRYIPGSISIVEFEYALLFLVYPLKNILISQCYSQEHIVTCTLQQEHIRF